LKLKRKLNRLTQFQKLLKIAKKMFQMNKTPIISNAVAALQALKDKKKERNLLIII
jgi:hypothetical protein